MSRSRLDNMDNLEKQLSDLQMNRTNTNSPSKVKKIPPAVPPKKKAQPQVPKSAVVNTICEPSYSMKITPVANNAPTYSNMLPDNIRQATGDYANVSHFSRPNNMTNQYMPTPSLNYSSFSNLQLQSINDNLLPPPPPPTLPSFHITQSKPYNNNNNINHEEYLPPPSPVSSNYSELARATANMNYNQDRINYPHIYQNEYPEYGVSQGSAYESLYEPINPHPRNNQNHYSNNSIPNLQNNISGKSPLPKEEEVDALTNLLVQSISDSQDLDVFGMCIKCGERVVGENSGCTAMGNMYHIQCFRCYCCKVNLQGKPFYAVEGQPYCETDYYETLEKCSVCTKSILDRILRATGKPYHPTCFTCVVCGKSLDGIPFTVDALNQIHCIEDFHKKFAPRCCVCELPIMPEEGEEETVRVVALDRSFHVKCYRCEDCGLQLSSEAEGRGCYPLDDHILCKSCNAHRICLLTNTPTHVMTTDL